MQGQPCGDVGGDQENVGCGNPHKATASAELEPSHGFTRYYGGGKGLFAFRTMEEIAEAVREINADYAVHCRAAYEIAAEHFEATKVVASILDRAGV